jgi:hypothetical protein
MQGKGDPSPATRRPVGRGVGDAMAAACPGAPYLIEFLVGSASKNSNQKHKTALPTQKQQQMSSSASQKKRTAPTPPVAKKSEDAPSSKKAKPGDASDGTQASPVSAANNARRQTSSIFNEPAPPPMRKIRANRGGDSNSTALCKVQGVVTRTREETVNGPKGPILKKRIDIVVTGVIANGAQDIVRSGVEGENFIFPSRQVDTPEAAETGSSNGNGFKAKARELMVAPMQKVRKLSTFSSSFYKESKEGGETGVNACEPGMLVEISGVCVNYAVNKMGVPAMYLNGGKVTCLMDKAPHPGKIAEHMIKLNQQERMQEWSAFACSIPARGFFDDAGDFLNPAQKAQATACQALWGRLIEGTADRLAIMAQGKDEELAAQINAHEQRVRTTQPEKLASGDVNLFLIDQYDSTIAPIVQQGLSPWHREPGVITKLNGTPEDHAALPSTFTAPWVVNVETNGKALSVDMRVGYVFNKEAACDAYDEGVDSPLLATTSAAIAMSLSLRDFAHKFGTLIEGKVTMACRELLPVADFAAFPKMSNIDEGGADAIKTDYPEGGTLYVDMTKTIAKAAVLVSMDFVKSTLCGGGNQFVPPKVKSDVPKLDFPNGVADMPDLEEYGYQEVTYASFDLNNWSALGDVEFRVVYPGVLGALGQEGGEEACSDAVKGEEFLKAAAGEANLKNFLTGDCLVYAVLP